jgi:hypothetical protein
VLPADGGGKEMQGTRREGEKKGIADFFNKILIELPEIRHQQKSIIVQLHMNENISFNGKFAARLNLRRKVSIDGLWFLPFFKKKVANSASEEMKGTRVKSKKRCSQAYDNRAPLALY